MSKTRTGDEGENECEDDDHRRSRPCIRMACWLQVKRRSTVFDVNKSLIKIFETAKRLRGTCFEAAFTALRARSDLGMASTAVRSGPRSCLDLGRGLPRPQWPPSRT